MDAETPVSYFQQRCDAIGLTPERNKLLVPEHPNMPDSKMIEWDLMEEDARSGDILIPLFDLHGNPANYYKDNSGKLNNGKAIHIRVRRYKPGNERKNKKGDLIKYDNPYGAKTLPWIAPNIIDAYRKKENIETVIITEGQIKAISGYLQGLYVFGIAGIQNVKDNDTKTLHQDILEVLLKCNVKNVILLYDGDCNAISLNAVHEGKDLYNRPHGFFTSARNSRELLKDYFKEDGLDLYFAHVNSEDLEDKPKGLDDLFEAFPDQQADIVTELTSFSKQKPFYFHRFNITAGLSKVYNHLHISTAEQFHTAHNQIIGNKPFVFHGTKYQYDEEKKELKVMIPGAARNYFRVGDHYFEKLYIPNKNGVLEYQYHRRLSGTIMADHGKEFLTYVPKYKAFCTKPDHVDYQEIISNCFNRYKPFEHDASQDDSACPEILGFMKHIFADQLEIGLDYVQLLYQRPTQTLPILCLVSRENNTGKSTFVKLMKAIFTGNMAIIGNQDLESDFNGGWADKLIIACEESFIDKKKTVEKIKSLSTGDKIQVNMKGVDQIEIDFFGKFIFCSNNEDNFVIANEDDERFWVRRVPKYTTERTNLLAVMVEEIPNFLLYLNKRQMANKEESRMWFNKKILVTEALQKLISGNTSAAEKEIRIFIRSMMMEHGFLTVKYTLKYLVETVLRRKYDSAYIQRLLKDKLKVETNAVSIRFKYPVLTTAADGSGGLEDKLVLFMGNGKPYTFTADNFLSPEEASTVDLSHEALSIGNELVQGELKLDDTKNDII